MSAFVVGFAMRTEQEFIIAADVPWTQSAAGVHVRLLSRADDTDLTQITRWEPGLDTSPAGVIRHDYVEEVYLLEGELTDLTLGASFGAGSYAYRPVGMEHGPYRSDNGCTMLEIRRPVSRSASPS